MFEYFDTCLLYVWSNFGTSESSEAEKWEFSIFRHLRFKFRQKTDIAKPFDYKGDAVRLNLKTW